MIVIDVVTQYAIKGMGFDYTPFTLSGNLPRFGELPKPTHYTTEGGGRYSMRPDLTRSGFGQALFAIAMSPAGMAGMAISASAGSIYAEAKNIESIVGSSNIDSATKIHMLQGLTNY